MRACFPFLAAVALLAGSMAHAQSWPDLTAALPPQGGGEHDAAVVVGISDYIYLPRIDGAADNAAAWQQWLVRTRKVPSERVIILRDREATRERIQKNVERMTQQVGADGTLWFVFVGHGAPSPSGDDGLLLGADTDADAESLSARGLPQGAVLSAIERSSAAHSLVLFDACFSGKTTDGSAPLVKGLQATLPVRKAAPAARATTLSASETFAGPLPSGMKPAFSYLVLGALRGWGDADSDGSVTADEAFAFAHGTLQAGFKTDSRLPSRRGPNLVLAKKVRKATVDIDAILAGRCPTGSVWQGERCTEPARIQCPGGSAWNGSACISVCPAGMLWNGTACAATTMACPEGTSWNGSACGGPRVAVVAPPPLSGAGQRAGETRRDDKGLMWVWMPPGSFHQGCEPQDQGCDPGERPGQQVPVAGFWMLQTEVTVAEYERCAVAGACSSEPKGRDVDEVKGCNWKNRRLEHPMNCVTHEESTSFCRWAGGTLPAVAEWEYAAKSGTSRVYPWGNEAVTGRRANFCDANCLKGLPASQHSSWRKSVTAGEDDGWAGTAPTGSFPRGDTPWGLKDISGNVREWTSSLYDERRIEARGGAWDRDPGALRASYRRDAADPIASDPALGFRCAQTVACPDGLSWNGSACVVWRAIGSRCPRGSAYIPPGRFTFGTSTSDPMRKAGEVEARTVELGGFCIDHYEQPNGKDALPTTGVSWQAAKMACEQVGRRLCSEVEWERACKGVESRRFPYGDGFDGAACNIADADGKVRGLAPAASFKECRSSFRVHMMAGNAEEWVADAAGEQRLAKGGAADLPGIDSRCSARRTLGARNVSPTLGFRCCADSK